MGSTHIVNAYVQILDRIKEQKRVLAELKDQQKALNLELIDYMNQIDEGGIRIDENTVITLEQKEKKIGRNKKSYKDYLETLCRNNGVHDESFIDSILSGKTETTVQQSTLKLVKTKKR